MGDQVQNDGSEYASAESFDREWYVAPCSDGPCRYIGIMPASTLYARIEETIATEIAEGEYRPGDQLPTTLSVMIGRHATPYMSAGGKFASHAEHTKTQSMQRASTRTQRRMIEVRLPVQG